MIFLISLMPQDKTTQCIWSHNNNSKETIFFLINVNIQKKPQFIQPHKIYLKMITDFINVKIKT